MIDRQKFFAGVRSSPFPGKIAAGQVKGMTAIIDEWDRRKLTDLRWLSYMLGTAKIETAHTMQPIKEMGGTTYFKRMYDVNGSRPALAKRKGNTRPGDGALYFGRGYVQLTWKNNYQRLGDMLRAAGLKDWDLVGNPDLALRPDIAAFIMFEGMIDGIFTGKKLANYFNAKTSNFIGARAIINGSDRAAEIADISKAFWADLQAAA